MRRFAILAIALFAIGCSSHSSVPSPSSVSGAAPQVVQTQPLPTPGWTLAKVPYVHGQRAFPIMVVSDGKSKMWFIDAANQVGSVSMGQQVKTFPLNISPQALTVGPDGNIWVTGVDSSQTTGIIAKVSTSGVETDYDVVTGTYVQLNGITVGPDGALWFTQGGYKGIDARGGRPHNDFRVANDLLVQRGELSD